MQKMKTTINISIVILLQVQCKLSFIDRICGIYIYHCKKKKKKRLLNMVKQGTIKYLKYCQSNKC